MADIAVEIAINLLTPLITEEISLISGLADDVQKIKDELCSILALLNKAEERAIGDEGTKVWVKQVRTLAYDIEDVIEEYQLFQKENKFHMVAHYILLHVRGMANTIKNIRKRAYDIGRARETYRLSNNSVIVEQGAYNSQTTMSSSSMYVLEKSELVGVEIPKAEIVELLGLMGLNKRSASTLAVVGMRGLGKTTIVRCIFNDLTSQGYFPMHAWISLSRTPRHSDILKSMIIQFYDIDNENKNLFKKVISKASQLINNCVMPTNYVDRINNMDQRTLQNLVRIYLEEERYLIVFYNVQDGDLELVTYVKHLLPTNNQDNKILVTTRNENIAHAWLNGCDRGLYKLKPLPSQIAWKLFCNKAFQSNEGRCPPCLEDLARGIVQKCEGLPPAILAIGCLLSTKSSDVLEWQKIYDSLGYYLEKNRHLTGIYGILVRNYYDLPSYLKPCFLHFGVFSKGYPVKWMRLIRLWIAEGFITKGNETLTLEEVAEEYLNELISMNLVEVGYQDPTGRPKTLRVHEFLHEIVVSKLVELSSCQIVTEEYRVVGERPRRLSIHKLNNAGKLLKSITKGKSKIRCLYAFELPDDRLAMLLSKPLLKNVHLLKVLDLCEAPIRDVPSALGMLRNLRYLSLRKTRVRKLPNSIGKLQDLQTLDLKQTFIYELPVEIYGLHMLRHLLIYSYEFDISYSPHIQRVRGVNIPKGALENFKELQKLAFIDLGNGTKLTKELRNLRRLGIIGLKFSDAKDFCGAIEGMKYLQSLNVYSKNESEMIDSEHIQSPPKALKRLYLNGPLSSFPRWIFDLHNLVKIRLRWSGLHDSSHFENLGTLPNLVELQLLQAYNGRILEFATGGFERLKILHLLDLHQLEHLLINEGALPHLQELSIGESPNLQVPPHGIQYLPNLITLTFFDMPQQFIDCIQPGQHSHSLVQHVPNVFFQFKCNQQSSSSG